ncbi:MAG: creatininase family protein, partial [Candidatus Aenigmatarchaeota archaeon]
IPYSICLEVGERSDTLVAPPVTFGLSIIPHMAGKGTIALDGTTFIEVCRDYIESLYEHGFRKFLCVIGHKSNESPFNTVVHELLREHDDMNIVSLGWWEFQEHEDVVQERFERYSIYHVEASVVKYLDEDLLKEPIRIKEEISHEISLDEIKEEFENEGTTEEDVDKITKDFGEEIFDISVEGLLNKLEHLRDI